MSPNFTVIVLLLTQISFVIFVTKCCSTSNPTDGTLYVSNVQLLDDTNYLLLTIDAFNLTTKSYCKILNINDGTLSNVVSCNPINIREWSTGDIDPTSTQIISATDNNDGTADVILRRNNANVGITGIPYAGSGGADIYFDQFTINSIHSTFVLLAPSQYNVEIIKVSFSSLSDNSSPSVKNFGIADNSWQYWEVDNTINMIPVYEDANAIPLPLACCLCDSEFIARYYFTYDATSGEISGIEIDTSIHGGKVDAIAHKAYDYGPFYPISIDVYDLTNIGGSYVTYTLDLTFVTDSPSKSPTNNPTNNPIPNTDAPSRFPSGSPSNQPSKSKVADMDNDEDGDAETAGFIKNISKNGIWIFLIIAGLLLCIGILICLYCVHSRKLKQRITTLEFIKVGNKNRLPIDTNSTDNFDAMLGNIDLRNNSVNTNDTNPVFIHNGSIKDEFNDVCNNHHGNVDADKDALYEVNSNEGALPTQPNVNQTDGMYNLPDASSSEDNVIDTVGKNKNVNEDTKDNQDMYDGKNKTFVHLEEAKQLNVSDKEAYLKDDEFQNVFGMTKDEFYKLKVWKQNNLKKKHELF